MYSSKDIKVIKAKDAIKKRPEMYFGSRGINAESICCYVAEGALILGAKETKIVQKDGWWFICADYDWMKKETAIPEVNENTLFESIYGFPEMGQNCFRWEALTKYFSDATLTTTNSETKLLSGSSTDRNEYESILGSIGNWGRVIGFRFNKNA